MKDKRLADMSGIQKQYGEWTVLSWSRVKGHDVSVRCKCSCGFEKEVKWFDLRTGRSKQCLWCSSKKNLRLNPKKFHNARLRNIYRGMIRRCSDPTCQSYSDYGGRGIKICSEWLSDYNAFEIWSIENGYCNDLTIERNNVNGDYSPDNCCWILFREQLSNTRRTVRLTYQGKTQTASQWSRELGISVGVITNRIRLGWDDVSALTLPIKIGNNQSLRKKNNS